LNDEGETLLYHNPNSSARCSPKCACCSSSCAWRRR